jgi:hypothetical protein
MEILFYYTCLAAVSGQPADCLKHSRVVVDILYDFSRRLSFYMAGIPDA